ncbi:MAG: hypothetical protein V4707_00390 [Pseudomonadota bacterium]
MRALLVSLLCLIGAFVSPAAAQTGHGPMDPIAREYVGLILEIGVLEPGYVDAYYGPAEWKTEAEAHPRDAAALTAVAADLTARLNAIPDAGLDPLLLQRKRYLLAHVSSAAARLRMIAGEKMGFADEAEALFGVRPELKPIESYDAVLARIDALLPGEGSIQQRLGALGGTPIVPPERLEAVTRAGIAECRRRTAEHITLPGDERFTLEFVKNEPWGAYNYYKGDAVSLIQVNTDQPNGINQAVTYGCHEGYPGHHVYNALLEQTFTDGRGWVEMSVYPLYSPMSLIAEGSAEYGVELAFPGDEREVFEHTVLYPMAGLEPTPVEPRPELEAALHDLEGVYYTIADDYLSGRVDRETTIQRMMRYQFHGRASAEHSLSFLETYRSYIINYDLGRDIVSDWVERQGPDHWAAMKTLLSSQLLPADLLN